MTHLTSNNTDFEQLYRTLFPRLVQFAASYTENVQDAEDIVQQAMLKLWQLLNDNENTPSFLEEGVQGLKSYLYTMVRNACVDYARHHAFIMERFVSGADEEVVEQLYQWDLAPSPEQQTIYGELRQQVDSLIASMPTRQQQVFRMSREEEMKNHEIADRLGLSLKAVEKLITASLKFLRQHLGYAKFIFFIFWM